MTSRIVGSHQGSTPGATGAAGAQSPGVAGAPGTPGMPFGHSRRATALLTLLLMAASVPVAAGEGALAVAIAAALSIAGGLSLRFPLAACTLIGLTFTLAVVTGPAHVGPGTLASTVAIASAAGHGRLLGAILMALWHVGALTAISVMRGDQAEYVVSELLLLIVLQGGAVVAGTWGRRLFERSVAERAQRLHDLSEQRRAIARELHDTGVRAMTEVVMLAENGALRPDADAGTARDFGRISATSRRAADDMRLLLDQLRGSAETGLADGTGVGTGTCLTEQLEQMRQCLVDSGFTVRVSVEGDCAMSDDALAVAIRCLDEVAANVVRHGERTTPVAIMTESLPGPEGGGAGIRVVVLNGVASRDPHGLRGGAGLEGVRERLATVGGRLEARSEGATFLTRIDIPGENP